jgi:hypothetical protein
MRRTATRPQPVTALGPDALDAIPGAFTNRVAIRQQDYQRVFDARVRDSLLRLLGGIPRCEACGAEGEWHFPEDNGSHEPGSS